MGSDRERSELNAVLPGPGSAHVYGAVWRPPSAGEMGVAR